KVTVQADYFFGKPVANARVELKALTDAAGQQPIDLLKDVAEKDRRTDDKGKFEVSFTVPPRFVGTERDGGDARLTFVATLTDTAEQKQERTALRLVTTRPNRVAVFPESGALVRGVANVVYVLATRADGSPVQGARVVVNGDASADLTTDEHGAASFTVTPPAEEVTWTVSVRSKGEREVELARRTDRLTCGKLSGPFLARPDRVAYKAGDTMTLTALGAGVEPVFVDLIKDGQTLVSQTIDVKDGKGEHQFDLPADLFGTIELVAYRFEGSGVAA